MPAPLLRMVAAFAALLQLGYCDDIVEIPMPPPVVMKTIEIMTKYLAFLDRCPIEPIRMFGNFQTRRPLKPGDVCTLGGSLQNSMFQHMYFVCVPNNSSKIKLNLAEVMGISSTLETILSEDMNKSTTSLEEQMSLSKFMAMGMEKVKKKGIVAEVSINIPGMEKCGVYEARTCKNEWQRFNYFTQTCINDTTLATGFDLYISVVKNNPFLLLPGFFLPRCILNKVPDAMQFVMMKFNNGTRDLVPLLRMAMTTAGTKGINTLRLLHLLIMDNVDFKQIGSHAMKALNVATKLAIKHAEQLTDKNPNATWTEHIATHAAKTFFAATKLALEHSGQLLGKDPATTWPEYLKMKLIDAANTACKHNITPAALIELIYGLAAGEISIWEIGEYRRRAAITNSNL